MNIYSAEIWLLVGIIFILIEFSTIPGIGFLFVGFGSLSNGILIYNYPELAPYQIAFVGIFSILWLLILWWPLKIFMKDKKNSKRSHFNIIGSEVKVLNNSIKPGSMGEVEWSGTIMNARLAGYEAQEALVGQKLYVVQVQGNILICSISKL